MSFEVALSIGAGLIWTAVMAAICSTTKPNHPTKRDIIDNVVLYLLGLVVLMGLPFALP